MSHKILKQLFHIDENKYISEYRQRLLSPYTVKLAISTKPNNCDEIFPMFLCITPEMLAITERIYRLTLDLERIIKPLPRLR